MLPSCCLLVAFLPPSSIPGRSNQTLNGVRSPCAPRPLLSNIPRVEAGRLLELASGTDVSIAKRRLLPADPSESLPENRYSNRGKRAFGVHNATTCRPRQSEPLAPTETSTGSGTTPRSRAQAPLGSDATGTPASDHVSALWSHNVLSRPSSHYRLYPLAIRPQIVFRPSIDPPPELGLISPPRSQVVRAQLQHIPTWPCVWVPRKLFHCQSAFGVAFDSSSAGW